MHSMIPETAAVQSLLMAAMNSLSEVDHSRATKDRFILRL